MRLLSLVAFASLIVCTIAALPPKKKGKIERVELDTIVAQKKAKLYKELCAVEKHTGKKMEVAKEKFEKAIEKKEQVHIKVEKAKAKIEAVPTEKKTSAMKTLLVRLDKLANTMTANLKQSDENKKQDIEDGKKKLEETVKKTQKSFAKTTKSPSSDKKKINKKEVKVVEKKEKKIVAKKATQAKKKVEGDAINIAKVVEKRMAAETNKVDKIILSTDKGVDDVLEKFLSLLGSSPETNESPKKTTSPTKKTTSPTKGKKVAAKKTTSPKKIVSSNKKQKKGVRTKAKDEQKIDRKEGKK